MTLPAFKAAGTGSETSPAWPTHTSGDFGLLLVENPDTNLSTPSGWTLIDGYPVLQAGVRLYAYYRFATSSSESAPSVTASADHNWGVILTFTGVNTANPFHLLSTAINQSNASHYWPGGQTYLDDCLIVCIAAWQIDNAGPLSSGETNASLGSLTERYDAGTITGNGGGLVCITGTLASKGNFVHTESTFSVASTTCNGMLALQAADKTTGQKSLIVNTRM